MVPSIARQSVIIKCNMQKSILTGNYEFYYAAGIIANLSGVEIPEDIKPEELLALLSEKIPTLSLKYCKVVANTMLFRLMKILQRRKSICSGWWRTTVPKMYMMSRCGNF